MKIIKFSQAAIGALFFSTTGFSAHAEEMVMSAWLPPQHPVMAKIMTPWANTVEQVTEGRVTIRVLPKPLGPPPAHYDLAADGVADITFGLHSFTKDDRFLRSRIGQFSFLGDKSETISTAFWDVYHDDLDAQGEHDGTKLLGLFVTGPGMFHNNKRKIETPEDFAGLKIRTPGGYIASLADGLGITTQFMSPGQVFEKISTGVIDGVTFPMEGVNAFKLADHLTHSMRVPGGIYNTTWFVVMNADKWDGLSAEDQAAIEAVSGHALAAIAGVVWDNGDDAGYAYLEGTDVEIYDAPESVVARIKEIADAEEKAWAEAVNETGFDGAAAIAKLRSATGQ